MLDIVADFRDAYKMAAKLERKVDIEDIADDAAAIILSRIRKRFLQQLSPELEKWKPSFASIQRQRSGRGGGTLFDSGRLFHSIQAVKRGEGVRGIQTDVGYGIDHHYGRNGQLQRRFLDTNDDDMQFITDMVIQRVKG